MVCVCVHAVVLAWYPRRQEFRAAGLSLQVAKPADAAPSGASLFIPEDREDEEEQKKFEEQLQQWRTTDVRPGVFDSQFITSISQPSKKARPKYVYKTVEELKVCACACVYVCTCMHACVCVCMCVHVYVCVCVFYWPHGSQFLPQCTSPLLSNQERNSSALWHPRSTPL